MQCSPTVKGANRIGARLGCSSVRTDVGSRVAEFLDAATEWADEIIEMKYLPFVPIAVTVASNFLKRSNSPVFQTAALVMNMGMLLGGVLTTGAVLFRAKRYSEIAKNFLGLADEEAPFKYIELQNAAAKRAENAQHINSALSEVFPTSGALQKFANQYAPTLRDALTRSRHPDNILIRAVEQHGYSLYGDDTEWFKKHGIPTDYLDKDHRYLYVQLQEGLPAPVLPLRLFSSKDEFEVVVDEHGNKRLKRCRRPTANGEQGSDGGLMKTKFAIVSIKKGSNGSSPEIDDVCLGLPAIPGEVDDLPVGTRLTKKQARRKFGANMNVLQE